MGGTKRTKTTTKRRSGILTLQTPGPSGSTQPTLFSYHEMRIILLAVMVAAVVACATARLSNFVKPYVGRDIHELSARLGNPAGKRETTGNSVYVWSADSEGVLPTTSSADGTRTNTMTVQYECTLEVTVSAQNVIQSYEIEGSDAGCAAFRRHLSR
jgi:hypothetical protein